MMLFYAALLLTVTAIFSSCRSKQAILPVSTQTKSTQSNALPTPGNSVSATPACAHPECKTSNDPLGHCLHEHLIFDELDCPECAYDIDCPDCNPLNNPLS